MESIVMAKKTKSKKFVLDDSSIYRTEKDWQKLLNQNNRKKGK